MFKNGSSLVDEVPEEYRAKVQENLEAAFKGRPYVHQFSMIKKDLSFVSVVIKYCPVENVFGKIDSVCVIMKNNTKQKLAEHIQERLQSSKEMFEEFMDCNSLLAWIADEDGIMRYMNRTYLKIFRITNTYKGKHMSELFPAEISEKYISNNKLALSKGGPTTTVEQAMLPNGSIKTYKVCNDYGKKVF